MATEAGEGDSAIYLLLLYSLLRAPLMLLMPAQIWAPFIDASAIKFHASTTQEKFYGS